MGFSGLDFSIWTPDTDCTNLGNWHFSIVSPNTCNDLNIVTCDSQLWIQSTKTINAQGHFIILKRKTYLKFQSSLESLSNHIILSFWLKWNNVSVKSLTFSLHYLQLVFYTTYLLKKLVLFLEDLAIITALNYFGSLFTHFIVF